MSDQNGSDIIDKGVDKAKDVVADVAEEVSSHASEFADYARQLNQAKVKFYLMGMAVGALTGAVAAFKVAYSRSEAKYAKIADEEISEMRQHYQDKKQALDAEAAKRPLEVIVEEQGYASSEPDSAAPPMAVQPPEEVVEDAPKNPQLQDNRLKPPVPVEPEEPKTVEAEVRNIFHEEAQLQHEWDYHEERRRRSPDIPYVIHYDEREEMEGYQNVTLTYYDVDNVVCNEEDEVLDPSTRAEVIGVRTLERFGHGSNDPSIVYVRNDKLETIFEIVKTPNSYAEEVMGFSHDDLYLGNVERMRKRERDDPEDE